MGAAGIFKALAGFQYRLLAYHPRPPHFLHPAAIVGDLPVPVEELHGIAAQILNGNVVRPHENPLSGIGLASQIFRLHRHLDVMRGLGEY